MMAWTRVQLSQVLPHLRADPGPDGNEFAAQALAHVTEALLNGTYVAVQDERGRMFIGTEAEAGEHIMGQATT